MASSQTANCLAVVTPLHYLSDNASQVVLLMYLTNDNQVVYESPYLS